MRNVSLQAQKLRAYNPLMFSCRYKRKTEPVSTIIHVFLHLSRRSNQRCIQRRRGMIDKTIRWSTRIPNSNDPSVIFINSASRSTEHGACKLAIGTFKSLLESWLNKFLLRLFRIAQKRCGERVNKAVIMISSCIFSRLAT